MQKCHKHGQYSAVLSNNYTPSRSVAKYLAIFEVSIGWVLIAHLLWPMYTLHLSQWWWDKTGFLFSVHYGQSKTAEQLHQVNTAATVEFCMDEVSTGSAVLSGKRHCPAFWFWHWPNLTISSGYSAFIFYLTTCKREEALLAVELLRLCWILSNILLMDFFIHCATVKPHSL